MAFWWAFSVELAIKTHVCPYWEGVWRYELCRDVSSPTCVLPHLSPLSSPLSTTSMRENLYFWFWPDSSLWHLINVLLIKLSWKNTNVRNLCWQHEEKVTKLLPNTLAPRRAARSFWWKQRLQRWDAQPFLFSSVSDAAVFTQFNYEPVSLGHTGAQEGLLMENSPERSLVSPPTKTWLWFTKWERRREVKWSFRFLKDD